MAELPAWSWLGVGVVIAVTAWRVKMPLFFWLGLTFIVIGVAKMLVGFMTRKEQSEPSARHIQHHPSLHPLHPERHQARLGHQVHQYSRCACGAPVRASDNFCARCGRQSR